MIEKYPNGTKTVEETEEYLAARRYVARFYIDQDAWFTTRILTLEEHRELTDAFKMGEDLLWGVSFKDSNKRDCIVRWDAIAWTTVANADPVYENKEDND